MSRRGKRERQAGKRHRRALLLQNLIYTFTIPRLPSTELSPNSRAPWPKRWRAQDTDRQDAMASFLHKYARPEVPLKKALVHVQVYFKGNRTRDLDNWNARMVGIWNGLKGLVFEDDSAQCIGQPQYEFIVDKAKVAELGGSNGAVKITVEGL